MINFTISGSFSKLANYTAPKSNKAIIHTAKQYASIVQYFSSVTMLLPISQ